MAKGTARPGGPPDRVQRLDRVLSFIAEYSSRHGYPPTIREIGEACEISSTSMVADTLRRLEQAGHIERAAGLSRAIRVTAAGNICAEGG